MPYETQTVAAAVTREAPESECLLSQFRCVNDSNRDNIISLVKEFRDVFSWSKYDIGLARNAEHKIELKDNGPIQEQTRRSKKKWMSLLNSCYRKILFNQVNQSGTLL